MKTGKSRTVIVFLMLIAVAGCRQGGPSHRANTSASDAFKLEQAAFYLEQGLTDSALATFGLAIEDNLKLTSAHMGMGNIYRERGRYQLASTSYEFAAQQEPNNFDAYYYLGLCYHHLGKIDSAVSRYLRALVIRPKNFAANQQLGSALLQLGRPSEAVVYARKAVRFNPNSQTAWANLGAAYILVGAYEKSVDAYRHANELGAIQVPILLGFSDALIQLKRYPQAVNVLKTLIHHAPDATAYERLGYCQWKTQQYESALTSYEAALQLDADDTSALNGKGVCLMTLYLQQGQKDKRQRQEAIKAWQQSVQLRPTQTRIVDSISRFQNP